MELENQEDDSHHEPGGCPVLVGSKWITNKWIHSNDQFLKFPCGLDFHDVFDTFNLWRRQ